MDENQQNPDSNVNNSQAKKTTIFGVLLGKSYLQLLNELREAMGNVTAEEVISDEFTFLGLSKLLEDPQLEDNWIEFMQRSSVRQRCELDEALAKVVGEINDSANDESIRTSQIKIVEAFWRKFERGIQAIPVLAVLAAFGSLAELDYDISEELVNSIQAATNAKNVAEKAQAENISALAKTIDIIGIFLRGHVLLENALDDCINAYLVKPLNLYEHLDVYFSQKIRLASAMGIISEEEAALLQTVNEWRNKLAHIRRNEKRLHRFDRVAQKTLWASYRSLATVSTARITFEDYEELAATKEIFVGLFLVLNARKIALASRRLETQMLAVKPSKVTRLFLGSVSRLLIRKSPMLHKETGI